MQPSQGEIFSGKFDSIGIDAGRRPQIETLAFYKIIYTISYHEREDFIISRIKRKRLHKF